jgi:alpha-N-arabinofuranosidase
MTAALGDAAWMTGMERNSDLVVMSCYAPLFVNVNKGAMQWRTDLIGYDALNSYGSPAYYAQQMFSRNHGDEVLSVTGDGVPTQEWQPPAPRRRPDAPAPTEPPVLPPVRQVPMLFFDATRDSKTGTIYVKVVNRAGTPQPVRLEIAGLAGLERKGQMITLKGDGPDDTNSISAPAKIVPVTTPVDGISDKFSQTFPAYSITVLQMKGR